MRLSALLPLVPSFSDELEKIAYQIEPEDRSSIPKKEYAQPSKEEAGHKGKYPMPDAQHYRSALGFAKMHHDSGALAAIHQKAKTLGFEGGEKQAGLKNWLAGAGLATAMATGAHAMHRAPAAAAAAMKPTVTSQMTKAVGGGMGSMTQMGRKALSNPYAIHG